MSGYDLWWSFAKADNGRCCHPLDTAGYALKKEDQAWWRCDVLEVRNFSAVW